MYIQLYFEHAEIYGPLLNIKIAQKKTVVGMVPMVGASINARLSMTHKHPGRLSLLPARPFPKDSRARSQQIRGYQRRICKQCLRESQVWRANVRPQGH